MALFLRVEIFGEAFDFAFALHGLKFFAAYLPRNLKVSRNALHSVKPARAAGFDGTE